MSIRKRRSLSLLLACFLLLSLPVLAQAEEAAAASPLWDITPLPEAWFDDAVFLGDSISVTLETYCSVYGGLGNAQFLCETSYGIYNALSGRVSLNYRGGKYLAQDVLPLTGAGKMFIMVGVNDIGGYSGVDAALERWEEFIGRVRAACPDMQIMIESALPIWSDADYGGLSNTNLRLYNDRLRAFCEENGLVFVDFAAYFRGEDGNLAMEYTSDFYVHVNNTAAELWVKQLRNPINYSVDPRTI